MFVPALIAPVDVKLPTAAAPVLTKDDTVVKPPEIGLVPALINPVEVKPFTDAVPVSINDVHVIEPDVVIEEHEIDPAVKLFVPMFNGPESKRFEHESVPNIPELVPALILPVDNIPLQVIDPVSTNDEHVINPPVIGFVPTFNGPDNMKLEQLNVPNVPELVPALIGPVDVSPFVDSVPLLVMVILDIDPVVKEVHVIAPTDIG